MKLDWAFAVLACATMASAGSALAAADPGRPPPADALAGSLRDTIAATDPAANEGVYEARLVAAIDQADVRCEVAVNAVRDVLHAPGSPAAIGALHHVYRAVSRCGARGTGASGSAGGGLAFGTGPMLGGGGGSDYQ